MKNKCSIPHISIDNFIPSDALVRAAAESFNQVEDWVKYTKKDKLFVIKMPEYDDTIGNIIQSHVSKLNEKSFINICGYRKPHPLEFYIELNLSPKEMYSNDNQTLNMLIQSLNNIILKIIDILNEINNKI